MFENLILKKIIRSLTDWEHWPFVVFYFPLFFLWGWYCLKSRAVWFFSAANPTITFGGFEGESKSEMYSQLPHHLYPETLLVQPHSSEQVLLQQVQKMFPFPFVVKPDVGMKGILFRKIENEAELLQYHRHMPATYLVQAFADYPHEVSVFYCRQPQQQKGHITAVIQKNLLQVTGNGTQTVLELLQQKGIAETILPEIKKQQGQMLRHVLPHGETLYLSHVGNRMNGASFINLSHQADAALLKVFDAISLKNQFCYGRYDIKCTSVESMKAERDFLILEFNGAGSIPNHIYTPGYTLMQAWKEIAKHWAMLYHISKSHHQNGVPYWGFRKGIRFLQQSKIHFQQLEEVDGKMLLK